MPEGASTVGTAHERRAVQPVPVFDLPDLLPNNCVRPVLLVGRHGWVLPERRPLSQARQHGCNLVHGQAIINLQVAECVTGHVGERRLVGVLYDGEATRELDGDKSGGAVVAQAAEDHPYHARAKDVRCRAEQRVNSGPQPIFGWPATDLDPAVSQYEMPIGGCHDDAPRLNRVPILGLHRGERASPAEDVGQIPTAGRGQVFYYEYRGR